MPPSLPPFAWEGRVPLAPRAALHLLAQCAAATAGAPRLLPDSLYTSGAEEVLVLEEPGARLYRWLGEPLRARATARRRDGHTHVCLTLEAEGPYHHRLAAAAWLDTVWTRFLQEASGGAPEGCGCPPRCVLRAHTVEALRQCVRELAAEAHYRPTLADLATELGVNRKTLHRHLHDHLGVTWRTLCTPAPDG